MASNNTQMATLDVANGQYTITVDMEGGSGKATITSPCNLKVEDGEGTATIEWSSSHYDYMIVDGEKYTPVNEDGNSVFEIPVMVYDEPMEVVADTTAMSTPHEIDYSLTFHSDELTAVAGTKAMSPAVYAGIGLGVFVIAALVVLFIRKRAKK